MRPLRFRKQAGFTLIEVLVSLLIFSFGLLGFVGLQARAIQYSVSAEDTNRAALLASDMGSTMLLLKNVNVTNPALAGPYATWRTRVADTAGVGLPNGVGTVSVPVNNVATITITWRATNAASGVPNAGNRYTTDVVLP